MKQIEKNHTGSSSPQAQQEKRHFFGSQVASNPLPPTFFGPATVQPMLEIGRPDDAFEHEADAMAERVLQHIDRPGMSAPPPIQRKCADCEKEEKLHRKETSGSEPTMGPSISDQLGSTAGSGFQLRPGLRTDMESAFQYDFSPVRLHTDSQAVQLSQNLNAQAFTYGNDIYFNSGKYNPTSSDGKRLLAHELTHVVQQGTQLRRKRIQRLPGSPAGGCGLCYGTPKVVGQETHKLVQQSFLARYPYLVNEHLLPVLLPGPKDEENGRLDLAELTGPDTINIAEIKPANAKGAADGASDIVWYKKQLEALGMKVGYLNLPPPYAPIPFPTLAPPPCPPTQLLFTDPAVAGVYTYWCTPDYKELVKICKCIPQVDPLPVPIPVPEPKDVKEPNTKRVPDSEPIKIPPLVPVGVAAALLTAGAYVAAKALIKRFPPVAIASAAAALLVLIAYPDRVYAGVGPGEDPLETLFKAADANGTPVPKELQDVIKNDPELKSIIENAAKSGDVTQAQEALNKKILETINNNLDQFSEEDLRILMSMTGSGSDTPTNAPTVEQLKAAIEAKRSGVATTPTPDGPGSGGAPITDTVPPTTPAPPGQEKFPKVSATVQDQFNTTSAPARELFKAMVGTSGNGSKVTDEFILRYLQTVPGDLSVEEAKKLIEQLKPVSGEDLDTIMQRLNQAIQTLRNPNPQDKPGDGKTGEEGEEGASSDVDEPAGQDPAVKDGDTTVSEFTRQMMENIQKFKSWDTISVNGTTLLAAGDTDFASTPLRGIVHAYAYTKGNTVLAITFLSIKITKRAGTKPGSIWEGTIVSSTLTVTNNGQTGRPPSFSTGKTVSATILSSK